MSYYIEKFVRILKCSTQAGFAGCLYEMITSGFKGVDVDVDVDVEAEKVEAEKDEPSPHC
jgi:hypothetical protein